MTEKKDKSVQSTSDDRQNTLISLNSSIGYSSKVKDWRWPHDFKNKPKKTSRKHTSKYSEKSRLHNDILTTAKGSFITSDPKYKKQDLVNLLRTPNPEPKAFGNKISNYSYQRVKSSKSFQRYNSYKTLDIPDDGASKSPQKISKWENSFWEVMK